MQSVIDLFTNAICFTDPGVDAHKQSQRNTDVQQLAKPFATRDGDDHAKSALY